jgi:hypothetical protein
MRRRPLLVFLKRSFHFVFQEQKKKPRDEKKEMEVTTSVEEFRTKKKEHEA